jgi:hypothetical protein
MSHHAEVGEHQSQGTTEEDEHKQQYHLALLNDNAPGNYLDKICNYP